MSDPIEELHLKRPGEETPGKTVDPDNPDDVPEDEDELEEDGEADEEDDDSEGEPDQPDGER